MTHQQTVCSAGRGLGGGGRGGGVASVDQERFTPASPALFSGASTQLESGQLSSRRVESGKCWLPSVRYFFSLTVFVFESQLNVPKNKIKFSVFCSEILTAVFAKKKCRDNFVVNKDKVAQ